MAPTPPHRRIDSQEQFLSRIAEEWRRAERSGKPSLLVLFDGLDRRPDVHKKFINILSTTFRETDVFGWFKTDTVIGVIFLELGRTAVVEARDAIARKIRSRVLPRIESKEIGFAVYVLPPYSGSESLNGTEEEFANTITRIMGERHGAVSAVQRVLDICGSATLLVGLSPILLAIAICIRMTSPGPALFRQTRAGIGGRTFGMFKFRTMVDGNDDGLHQDYVKRFINGAAEQHLDEKGQAVYKLTRDPRVTRFGRFLRQTSLDELPQLWNVLVGEMSLVGPRPPLPYELECYDLWHRRRVYELKPGITGLWQVRGRSRCTFDEMTRLDLQHAHPRSLGLYLKVLVETPRAVIRGCGAH